VQSRVVSNRCLSRRPSLATSANFTTAYRKFLQPSGKGKAAKRKNLRLFTLLPDGRNEESERILDYMDSFILSSVGSSPDCFQGSLIQIIKHWRSIFHRYSGSIRITRNRSSSVSHWSLKAIPTSKIRRFLNLALSRASELAFWGNPASKIPWKI
jgi:hypothetical protein